MKPGTLITVFGKYPGVVKADGKFKPPEGYIRVQYRGQNQTPVAAYVPRTEVKERRE